MNDNERYPSPLFDARFGTAIAASMGMFDPPLPAMRVSMGKKPKPAGVVGKILRRLILGKPMDRR